MNQYLELLYAFVHDKSIKTTTKQTRIPKATIIKYFKFYKRCLSKVIEEYFAENKLRNGIVEIDESLAVKKYKHGRGNKTQEHWMVCALERNTG